MDTELLEKIAKRLHALRQDLATSQRHNYVSTRGNVKQFDECLADMDKLIDDFESEIYPSSEVEDFTAL